MTWDCHRVGAEKGGNNNIVIVGTGVQCTFVGGIVVLMDGCMHIKLKIQVAILLVNLTPSVYW